MHHKRGRASNQRAGCKMCKPWKVNGFATERVEGEKFSDHVRRTATVEAIASGEDEYIETVHDFYDEDYEDLIINSLRSCSPTAEATGLSPV